MSHFNEREFEEIVVKGTNWENVCAGGLQSFYKKIIFYLNEIAPLKKCYTQRTESLDYTRYTR